MEIEDTKNQLSFSRDELDTLDRIWRELPEDHVWCGWASVGQPPDEVSIFRTRAHWRRFRLIKPGASKGYALLDERARVVASGRTLGRLLRKVEAIPGLRTAYLPEDGLVKDTPGEDQP